MFGNMLPCSRCGASVLICSCYSVLSVCQLVVIQSCCGSSWLLVCCYLVARMFCSYYSVQNMFCYAGGC